MFTITETQTLKNLCYLVMLYKCVCVPMLLQVHHSLSLFTLFYKESEVYVIIISTWCVYLSGSTLKMCPSQSCETTVPTHLFFCIMHGLLLK